MKKSLFIFLTIVFFILVLPHAVYTTPLVQNSDSLLEYYIIPEIKNGSVIDNRIHKELSFRLYKEMDDIYYNGFLLDIQNDTFKINISDYIGKTEFIFTNSKNDVANFYYYFPDKKGKLNDYPLIHDMKLNVYLETFNNIKIIYTDKEKSAVKVLKEYINKLPTVLLENVDTIKMIPYENIDRIAGMTKNNNITLYKFSKYTAQTQKNIIYHEIGHTWANKLKDTQLLDYVVYSEIAQKDNNFVSHYSQTSLENTGNYSEDFAESIAFYFISSSFKKNYPNRFNYIQNLINISQEFIITSNNESKLNT